MLIHTLESLGLVLWPEALPVAASRWACNGGQFWLLHFQPAWLEGDSCCSPCELFAGARWPPYNHTPHCPGQASNETTSPNIELTKRGSWLVITTSWCDYQSYNSSLLKVDCHYDHLTLMFPDHAPEVFDGILHGTLSGYVLTWNSFVALTEYHCKNHYSINSSDLLGCNWHWCSPS